MSFFLSSAKPLNTPTVTVPAPALKSVATTPISGSYQAVVASHFSPPDSTPMVEPDSKEVESHYVALVAGKPVVCSVGTKPKARTKGRTGSYRSGSLVNRDGTIFNNNGRPPILKTPSNNGIHNIVQSYEASPWMNTSASVPTFAVANFVASNVDQIGALTAVFDQYRFARIEAWITPRVTSSNSSSQNVGLLHTVIDFDDSTNLSSVAQANDYTNVVVSSGLDGHYRTFVPHAALAAYSGTFTSYANVEAPWIDAASTGVQHYGIKAACTTTDVTYMYDLVVRIHMQWRNVR